MASNEVATPNSGQEGFKMKQQISLFGGCTIIVGIIVGSGIFVSPKGVVVEAGSAGLSLLIWLLSGVYTMLGAICYAELGTTIPSSGGEYAYLSEIFGPLPGFLFLWIALIIINPASNAILSLTFAQYSLEPFYPNCEVPKEAVRLLAATVIVLFTFINCISIKWTTRTQNVFTVVKVFALLIIIVAGIAWLFQGHTDNLTMPEVLEGSYYAPGSLALAFYSGVFTYSGWNYLNFVTEELINPYKNLIRAILISIPFVTLIYLLANISYLSVLTVDELIQSPAVAITFGNNFSKFLSAPVPILVAISCIGGLNGIIFSSSRIFFAGARKGHLPRLLAMINVKYLTPMPSLILLCIFSLLTLIPSDVYVLINYLSFAEIGIFALTVIGLIKLRYSQPDRYRPIKVPLLIPFIFVALSILLVLVPLFNQPIELLVGLGIIISGVPAYCFLILWQNKPRVLQSISTSFTVFMQKLLLCAVTD